MIFSRYHKKNGVNKYKAPFLGVLIIAAFVWAMINLVEVVGSIIVLWHHNGYQEVNFTIRKVHYHNDYETGLVWGFIGNIPDGEARMYAPRLVNAKKLGYQKLREMYPPGMQMKVWYNPRVTDTLFQHRTLQIVPYTPDLVNSELAVIYRWMLYCLLPFAGALLFSYTMKE